MPKLSITSARLALFTLCLSLIGLSTATKAASPTSDRVEHGRYLSAAANCRSCHTRDGGAPYAGGKAFKTPLGTIYSPNITPDKKTGIGDWSDANFLRAMHEGIGAKGEQLYPAFPYTDYTHIAPTDVAAIKAYLDTVPAVSYTAPANDLMFPFNFRPLIRAWKWINFTPGKSDRTAPAAEKSPARGRYLTQALGHCGQCHTPRTLTYGVDDSRQFAGAKQSGWYAWNITHGPDGLADWPDAELDRYLATGHVEDRAVASGPMAEVISNSTRHLSDTDRAAMIAYLRTVESQQSPTPGRRHPPTGQADRSSAGSTEGRALYGQHCASCHAPDAPGGAETAFADYATVTGATPDNLIRVLLEGIERTGADGRVFMPGYATRLTDAQIADLANVVRARYSDNPADIRPADVADIRESINE